MEFLAEYGLFFLKVLTFVIAIIIVIVVATSAQGGDSDDGEIKVSCLNDQIKNTTASIECAILPEKDLKAKAKQQKKDRKHANKADESAKNRVYVLEFIGDMRAKAAEQLRKEVTAVLSVATPNDEIVIKLESPGGVVHGYGFAASQLKRVRDAGIPLTICVDKVAASGGYMMSCIGSKIIAAPFAMIGSIGVVAQIPNFHKVLQKNDIDYELHTAGEYKRTLTMFGENTDEGRAKFNEELELTHELFKTFVSENRPSLNIEAIATGEVWFGSQALENKLIDELGTSDEYLYQAVKRADVYSVKHAEKKTWQNRLGFAAEATITNAIERVISGLWVNRFK